MARSAIIIFFSVAAVALRVADCRSAESMTTTTEYVPTEADYQENEPLVCGPNEIAMEERLYYDAWCSHAPFTRERSLHSTYYRVCECPDGFCRDDSEACVRQTTLPNKS